MRGWLTDLFHRFLSGAPSQETPARPELPFLRDLRYRRESKFAHECGHAVVAWFSPAVSRVDSIDFSLIGARVSYGFRTRHPEASLEDAVISLAGLAGETLVWGRVRRYGFTADFEDAKKALKAYFAQKTIVDLRKRWNDLADSSLDVSAMQIPRVAPEIGEGLNICYRRAKRIIAQHRAGFDRLLALVQRKGDLTAEDIASQFGPRIWAHG